ncbi:uncharacterized protein LOC133804297 [Humulus lupulus]|uniref:uncharacterized protein LOC133804297 n=1 Tax=Humulus lupulus TaxID=3486 RepID=UPI002B40AD2F|nr:uncharacterized protein LOC133804297 [Humulus lupulus]
MGNTLCRFGIAKFALVTRLNFGNTLSPDELREHLSSDRIIQEHLNGDSKFSFGQLEDALKASTNPEDAFKLSLCYLIEGIINAPEKTTQIWVDSLKMVENLDYFFKYPWGELFFKKVIRVVQKDMQKKLKHYEEKKKEGSSKKQELKYSFYDYVPTLLYWAFEVMPTIESKYGENSGNQIPRMLSWATKTDITLSTAELVPMFAKR